MARKRLIAIPSSSFPVGFRIDYSPMRKGFVFYAWWTFNHIWSRGWPS